MILEARGNVIAILSSKPKVPPGAGDNLAEAQEAAKKAALSTEAGVQQGVWGLTYDGAELIQDTDLG